MAADNSDIHDRSLFQLGDWHIVRSRSVVTRWHGKLYAVHTNCKHNTLINSTVKMFHNHCHRCGDMVPDELQALVTLYRWET